MREVVSRHETAEGSGTVAAAMATLAAETFHGIQPLGLVIRSRAAVEEVYRRVLPSQQRTVADRKRKSVWFSWVACCASTSFWLKPLAGRRFRM